MRFVILDATHGPARWDPGKTSLELALRATDPADLDAYREYLRQAGFAASMATAHAPERAEREFIRETGRSFYRSFECNWDDWSWWHFAEVIGVPPGRPEIETDDLLGIELEARIYSRLVDDGAGRWRLQRGVRDFANAFRRSLARTPNLEAALAYRAAGHCPLPAVDKRPALAWGRFHGEGALLPSIGQIEGWWGRACPDAAVQLLTGQQFDVFDVEAHGLAALAGKELPVTPTSRTQGGGKHFFFAPGHLRQTIWKPDPGGRSCGDIRCYTPVSVPPTAGGKGVYTWEPGLALGEVPLAVPPPWLVGYCEATQKKQPVLRGSPTKGVSVSTPTAIAPPPQVPTWNSSDRSEADYRHAITMYGNGFDPHDIVEALMDGEVCRTRLRTRAGFDPHYYATLTVSKAVEYVDGCVPHVVVTQAETRAGNSGDNYVLMRFRVDEAQGHGHYQMPLAQTINWPIDDRSRERWGHLCRAVDLDPEKATPEDLVDLRLCIEIRWEAHRRRCGRFWPARDGVAVRSSEEP